MVKASVYVPRGGVAGLGFNLLTTLLCIVLLRVCSSLDGLFLKLVAASAATQRGGALDLMMRLVNVENSLAAFSRRVWIQESRDLSRGGAKREC